MLASAHQASLIPYPEEGGLVLASAGEGHMDILMLAGMEQALLIWDMAIHTMPETTLHFTDTHITVPLTQPIDLTSLIRIKVQ